jgi:hypothetical protein
MVWLAVTLPFSVGSTAASAVRESASARRTSS